VSVRGDLASPSPGRAGERVARGPAEAPVALVCAVPAERRALRGLTRPGVELHLGGMGALAAARTGRRVVSAPVRALMAVGFCGALSPELRVGDLVAAHEVLDEATGERFAADPGLLAAAPGRRATLVSARRLARTPAQRAALSGDAVDLESAALARAAASAGVPFLALRAVTDEIRHRMPDFERIAGGADTLRPWAGITYFLLHPAELPRLVRLAPAAGRAGRALARGLTPLLAEVA
jgi:adenosylhomocysteine nucleosidase